MIRSTEWERGDIGQNDLPRGPYTLDVDLRHLRPLLRRRWSRASQWANESQRVASFGVPLIHLTRRDDGEAFCGPQRMREMSCLANVGGELTLPDQSLGERETRRLGAR